MKNLGKHFWIRSEHEITGRQCVARKYHRAVGADGKPTGCVHDASEWPFPPDFEAPTPGISVNKLHWNQKKCSIIFVYK